jgi:2-methylcitrate dehydratase PrpD
LPVGTVLKTLNGSTGEMSIMEHQIEQGLHDLVAWAASLETDDIPIPALKRAALVISDDLGAIIASRNEPEVVRVHDQLLRNQALPEATVFRGGRPRTDRYSAAAANAAAADWAELDEGYRKAVCHAGLYSLPSLLAEAEAEDARVIEVLRAAVISYEITTRFARVWRFPSLTLHPHAIFNAIGASSAAAALRGLTKDVFENALTASATLVAIGPFDHAVKGALIRNMWPAAGAWNGMRCVDWAQCGIGGLASTPNDVYAKSLGAEPHPDQFTAGLGEEWAISDGYHKIFACCQYSHSAVEAALALREDIATDSTGSAIKSVLVETHSSGLSLCNYNPPTSLAARFSMPYIVAASLVLGEAGAEAFSSTKLVDPEIKRLLTSVELRLFEPEQNWPNDRPARVTVELEDGTSLSRECMSAAGGPDRPFSEKQILDKISHYTGDVYPNFRTTLDGFLRQEPDVLKGSWDGFVGRLIEKG